MTRQDFLFSRVQSGHILDVGNLGRGGEIHKRLIAVLPHAEIHGLDIESQEKYGFDFPHQAVGSAEALPYPDGYFNTIYLGEVLEHTWLPRHVVNECYRVLKPQGVLILDTPNVYALSRMLRFLAMGRDIILGNPDHKIFYSRAMMENLLEKSGFQKIESTTDSKFTIKGRDFKLPRFGPCAFLGEHLLAAAWK